MLFTSLCAVVVEEFIFLGVALSVVLHFSNAGWGVAVSSLLFGVLHVEKGFCDILVVVGYGAILGSGLVLGSSLVGCIGAHALGNALAFFFPPNLVGRRAEGAGS